MIIEGYLNIERSDKTGYQLVHTDYKLSKNMGGEEFSLSSSASHPGLPPPIKGDKE